MIQFATAKLLIGDFITFIGTLNQYLIIRITKIISRVLVYFGK